MMRTLTKAHLSWFNHGTDDARYLDLWADAALTYTHGQPIDSSWHQGQHEVVITTQGNQVLFDHAADLLMLYDFYPQSVMRHTSRFDLEGRWAQPGDDIVQRIHLVRIFGRPVLDVIAMSRIIDVMDEPRRKGLAYATTTAHSEVGQWSARVEWRSDDSLVCVMVYVSRPAPDEPRRNHGLMRWLQRRAHRLGMAHFRQQVLLMVRR